MCALGIEWANGLDSAILRLKPGYSIDYICYISFGQIIHISAIQLEARLISIRCSIDGLST